jgi:intracellular multiplication protein IcmD
MFNYIKKVAGSALFKRGAVLIGSALGALCVTSVMAAGPSAVGLTEIGKNVDNSVFQLARVLTDVALIAGVGFVMASFFKFHQHKLNPTQVPLSQGVTLMLIGAGLMLFPTILPTATQAVFGKQATIAQVGGSQIKGIIGGGSGASN